MRVKRKGGGGNGGDEGGLSRCFRRVLRKSKKTCNMKC